MITFEIDNYNAIISELDRLAEMSKIDGKYTQTGLTMQDASSAIRQLMQRVTYLEEKLCYIEDITAKALR
mgnify:CR=1 FL=1